MPVTDVHHDLDTRTLTITAEFAAPVDRIWKIYVDPRQLEQVFGPPSHPATFVELDVSPGGRARYFMTAPDGQRFYGWWEVVEVDEPHRLSFEDGFASDDSFTPTPGMPVSSNEYRFESIDTGTRATFRSTYASVEALEKVLEMGAVEGSTTAINQIDDFVAS